MICTADTDDPANKQHAMLISSTQAIARSFTLISLSLYTIYQVSFPDADSIRDILTATGIAYSPPM
jgi:hypothetical protein